MRVVAGELGRRRIKDVKGEATRATSDKVKEASFQRMGPFFEGGICLDLFAGSGGLGIEAISRGLDYTIFVDKHPKATQVIQKNIESLNIKKRTRVIKTNAMRALDLFEKEKITFDLILLDPPFHSTIYEKALHKIHAHGLLNERGIIYCEHDKQLTLDWNTLPFIVSHSSTYGTIHTKLLSYAKK